MVRACLKSVLSALVLLWSSGAMAQSRPVDLALVLAVDCSFSVNAAEFRLQMQGIGQALQDPLVWKAIQNGPYGRIAVVVMEWSDKENQQIVLPWTIISSQQEAVATGFALKAMQRNLAEGGTAISRAISVAAAQFPFAPSASRKVIDVSFDGRNNTGPALPPVRNQIVSQGVVINALPIINEVLTLDVYAENQLIGGQGAFVIKANDYQSFGEAILRKLIREIVGPGIS
jgi:Protein of unknown function (DUF1194)